MKKYELKVAFSTPAFLGNADQQGQWRTPAFKALLRQWWRVAAAADCSYQVAALRKQERELFGAAADDGSGGKSKVRLRLEHWDIGGMDKWEKGFGRVDGQVGSDVYLGYGPISSPDRKKGVREVHLTNTPAISLKDNNLLKIMLSGKCTEVEIRQIEDALQLLIWFGTLGGRSRNGWGSLAVISDTFNHSLPDIKFVSQFVQPLEKSLRTDWVDSFSYDSDGMLVWLKQVSNWKEAVNEFAVIRKESRKSVKGIDSYGIKAAYALGYPLTKSIARCWDDKARIPDQLRFKLLDVDNAKYIIVFHTPCTIPETVWKANQTDLREWMDKNKLHIWQQVHSMLDDRMPRLGGVK